MSWTAIGRPRVPNVGMLADGSVASDRRLTRLLSSRRLREGNHTCRGLVALFVGGNTIGIPLHNFFKKRCAQMRIGCHFFVVYAATIYQLRHLLEAAWLFDRYLQIAGLSRSPSLDRKLFE